MLSSAHAGAAEECPSCPVCTGLALLRARHPEAHEHLSAALSAMMTLLRDTVPGTTSEPEGATVPAGPFARQVVTEHQIEVTD